jgi:hypothetical protein
MADPKPGDPGYQEWLNKQVAQHDAEQQQSGNPNQTFEIAPPPPAPEGR